MILKDSTTYTDADIKCFKAYDIRGKVPAELNEGIAYRIGRAYAEFIKNTHSESSTKGIIVGRDIRLTSKSLSSALIDGLTDSGIDVFDIGLCGTEEVYFAVFSEVMDGGIMITASHNPKDYNGMKFVRENSKPISGDSGLNTIRDMVIEGNFSQTITKGKTYTLDIKDKYIKHLLSYIDIKTLKPYKIVANAGNGTAGLIIDRIEKHLPFKFIKINHEPDGSFPNGIPNPLLPENRDTTSEAVIEHRADIGLAWDGDFDRCFFFDERGNFIEGYYIVGILAEAMCRKHPKAKIIHDPRLIWNTIDIVKKYGGIPIQSKTGHAFIKERMRSDNAVYGGEMSAHHYFREFAYCDSGMIPWLFILEIMSLSGKKLSELVQERMMLFPVSGEINRVVKNSNSVLKIIEDKYRHDALSIDYTDGISMEFTDWRFNLRCSNTEPVIRLNIEARRDRELMQRKTDELLAIIDSCTKTS